MAQRGSEPDQKHSKNEHLYEDFVARSRYLGQGLVIASHSSLLCGITYPCIPQ